MIIKNDHTSFLPKAAPIVGAVTLSLSLPPSVNHCYLTSSSGMRLLTREARDWMTETQTLAVKEKKRQGWQKAVKTWLVCELIFYMPDKRKRDTHNYFKVLFDALEGVLYDNDYYVMPRVMGVEIDRENPRIDLSLREV